MMKIHLSSLATLAFLMAFLTAQESRAQSQHEMNREAEKSFQAANAALNAVYKKLRARIDKENRDKLRASQNAWIVFRDAEAELIADLEARGGSMAPMIYEGTRAELTKKRTAELQKLLNDYGR
jgi:uncharacterized protein YecT (DUF1311 family)